MISARVYSPSDATDIEPADIGRAWRTDRLLWVDAVDPSEIELAQLQEQFDLHPLAIEDVRERHERAKLEHYRTHSFLVAYSAGFVEVNLFVGPSWLITVREEAQSAAHWPVDRARRRYERTRREPFSVGHLVYVLLDELVDGYFDAIDRIEEALERIEDSIFAETLGDERPIQQELYGTRRTLLGYRHAVAPLRDVLGRHPPRLDPGDRHLRDELPERPRTRLAVRLRLGDRADAGNHGRRLQVLPITPVVVNLRVSP